MLFRIYSNDFLECFNRIFNPELCSICLPQVIKENFLGGVDCHSFLQSGNSFIQSANGSEEISKGVPGTGILGVDASNRLIAEDISLNF